MNIEEIDLLIRYVIQNKVNIEDIKNIDDLINCILESFHQQETFNKTNKLKHNKVRLIKNYNSEFINKYSNNKENDILYNKKQIPTQINKHKKKELQLFKKLKKEGKVIFVK